MDFKKHHINFKGPIKSAAKITSTPIYCISRGVVAKTLCIIFVVFITVIASLVTPLAAQQGLVVVSPTSFLQPVPEIYTGPDPDSIYFTCRPGPYKAVEAPEDYIHRVKGELVIQMAGFTRVSSPGDPALPYQVYHVALPPDVVPESLRIEVLYLSEKEIPGTYEIAPAPPYLLDQKLVVPEEEFKWEFTKWGTGKSIVEGRNSLIYETDALHPEEYCTAVYGGQMRKWKVAAVVYYPFRYNPVTSKLVLAEEISVKISFERDDEYLEAVQSKKLLRDDTFDDLAKELFLNYDQAVKWYLDPLHEGLADYESDEADPDYAIITTDYIFSNSIMLSDFCFHKQDLGYTVVVVTEQQTHTVEVTPESYYFSTSAGGYEGEVGDPPNERPQKIREWLENNYAALLIEYVLLLGDPDPNNIGPDDLVGDIPMQLCWDSILTGRPTDRYYSDLSGDWNLDNDDYFGEEYEANPVAGYSFKFLPAFVTGDQFCVRWEGVVNVSGAHDPATIDLYGYSSGEATIWFDEAVDGYGAADIILDDATEHHPEFNHFEMILPNGSYPIKIEYLQSNGDAYFYYRVSCSDPEIDVSYKHDDGTGTLENGLEADYYNDNDFSDPPDVEKVDFFPHVEYIPDGDRGPGGVDFYPEVIVGRIPVYDEDVDGNPDVAILDDILAKTIVYENADAIEEAWRRRVLISTPYMYDRDATGEYTTADYRGGEELMDNVAPPPLWEWYRIHEEPYADVIPPAEVNTGCNYTATVEGWNDPLDPDDGRGVVMWRTHGSQISAEHVFHEDNCTELDDSKPSIVIQTTCQNGHPEVEFWGADRKYPLGYTLLKQGAVATISSTRNSRGGEFNPDILPFLWKTNPYLMYFLAKGIFDNGKFGDVVSHVLTEDALLGSWWGQIFNYNLYGDPTLSLFGTDVRSSNDVVFLLDGSGSMLNEGKWDAAVDATVLYYELMNELRHPSFDDRYNSVVFRWFESQGVDGTTTVPAGTGLKDIGVPLTPVTLDTMTPISQYWTPIGEGLRLSLEQFELETEEGFYSNKVILLLSDGKQNRGINPLTVVIPDGVKVYAVGIGEDDIEPETISDIAGDSEANYRISPSPRDMEDFFIQILCDTSWKLQDVTVTEGEATIDQDIAVFIVVWDDPSASLGFDLDPPGAGPDITPTTGHTAYPPMTVTYHAPAAGETHAYYVCRDIPSDLLDAWNFTNINDGGVDVPLSDVLTKVVVDPRTIAHFEIENVDHYTGQPIRLTAKVTEGGKPKTGLDEVYVELVRSPAQSVGTLMAQNSPPPDYPSQPTAQSDLTLYSHYLLGIMEELEIDALSEIGDSRIQLRDDGIGCDNRADDGVYTGTFTDTSYEGSYTFKFRAAGLNQEGVAFDRTKTLSEYVKFSASPDETEIVVETAVDKKADMVTATITVTPRDEFGSYMGPLRSDPIRLRTNSGDLETSYTDNLDGSYSFKLTFPLDSDPRVSVSVGDMVVTEKVTIEVEITKEIDWLEILRYLVIFIILLIIIILWRRRS